MAKIEEYLLPPAVFIPKGMRQIGWKMSVIHSFDDGTTSNPPSYEIFFPVEISLLEIAEWYSKNINSLEYYQYAAYGGLSYDDFHLTAVLVYDILLKKIENSPEEYNNTFHNIILAEDL